MTTNSIFGNDILSAELDTSLVPELGNENISLGITPQQSSFIDPLNQELSLIEQEIVLDKPENSFEQKSSNNNSSSINNISLFNIDPLIGSDVSRFQVNNINASNASFAPPQNELEFQGGFGDYDGGNDVTFEVKNDRGIVVETYALSGEGQATLYRDEDKAYVFFSGTDKSTNVNISAKSNIQFGNYIGDSLKIETTGSIEGGDIVLNDPDETGLVLRSGLEGTGAINSSNSLLDGYEIVDLGGVRLTDLNNLGQAVGNGYFGGNNKGFFYDGSKLNVIDRYDLSIVHAVNDAGDIVGEQKNGPFYTNGGQYIEPKIGFPNYEFLVDINNIGTAVGYIYTDKSLAVFHQNGRGIMPGDFNQAYGINDLNQIIGYNYLTNQSYLYYNGATTQLENLPGNNYSFAHDINNLGQIVGITGIGGRGNKTEAFLYDDGVMQTIGVETGTGSAQIGSPNFSYGIGINDKSQVVVTSSSSEPFLYQNGELTNLNDLITPEFRELGWVLNSVKEINNQSQIIGQATFMGGNHGVILNPLLIAPPNDDYIRIGNISTFGDTVLLQGNEITLTGEAITTQGGKITLDGATTVNGNLTINSSVIENEVITGGGDITFTKTLDATSAATGNLRLQAGTGNIVFGDIVGGEATFNNINILGAKTVTANGDITSSGLIKINATEDINTQNITSETGNIKLTSEEKSITALDITSGNEGGNIVLEGVEGVYTANLNAHKLGIVKIKSGDVLEDNTVVIGSTVTNSITGKIVDISSTGSSTAIGDITAHDGKVTITTHDDIKTKKIESLAKSINLVSTDGGVTIEGELFSADGGIGIIAKDDITTQKINSLNGLVGLSSYLGGVIVEDDITTVKGGVVIAGREAVQITNIDTQVGEVNIGSSGDILVRGNISTDTGYINIKTNGNISAQSATTNKGYVEIAAGGIASANIATGIGTSTLISVANLDDDILIAGDPDGIISSTVTRPQDLSDQEAGIFTEFVESLVYRSRPLGEFVLGALYEWAYSNGAEIRGLMPGFLKLSEKEEAQLNARLNQSQAFELGRTLGEGAAVAQGIYEFIVGSAAVGGGGGLCITGIGCFAGAPAIATGVILQAHGGTLAVNSANDLGESLRDILSPNRMESSGGADDVIGLSRETGISQGSIEKVYGDVSPDDIRFLDDKLDKNLVETLFDKAKDTITNVSKTLKLVGDDNVAVDSVKGILRRNKNGKIEDVQLDNAFSETVDFYGTYKNKVTGDFPDRFVRAKGNPKRFDPDQALGEIQTGKDFLDNKTQLGSVDKIKGIPENTLQDGIKTPDYLLTETDGITRLAEVKTPNGNFRENNLQRNLTTAIKQIKQSNESVNAGGYIRIDYTNKPATTLSRNRIEDYAKLLIEQAEVANKIEFVEILYNDANGKSQLLLQIKNGIINLIN